jgi:hypothetical protein
MREYQELTVLSYVSKGLWRFLTAEQVPQLFDKEFYMELRASEIDAVIESDF